MTQGEILEARLSCELAIENAIADIRVATKKLGQIQGRCDHPKSTRRSFGNDSKIDYCPDCGRKYVYRP